MNIIHDYLQVPIQQRLRWFKGDQEEDRFWTGRQKVAWLLRTHAGPKGLLP